ncbi:hypothetical protein BQ8794_240225 [Mesorhizobium prunaredense]|uniref:Uncharacterized protein n=1 Tax=Mesorhizobium prunaredense TaxID=1631249 RepID=A0A1R3VCA8_9HYPH|nr:hypothetical protein BQ8794_240225 [Mesorhizobium prunaredense]
MPRPLSVNSIAIENTVWGLKLVGIGHFALWRVKARLSTFYSARVGPPVEARWNTR